MAQIIDNRNQQGGSMDAAKGIISIIDSMADAQKAQLDVKKNIMLMQIKNKMDLKAKEDEFQQNMGHVPQIQEANNKLSNPMGELTNPGASSLGQNGIATNSTPTQAGSVPPLQGKPMESLLNPGNPIMAPQPSQTPGQMAMAAQPTPQAQPTAPVTPAPIPQGVQIESPLGIPLPPPKQPYSMDGDGKVVYKPLDNHEIWYNGIYKKWRSGTPLTADEKQAVKGYFGLKDQNMSSIREFSNDDFSKIPNVSSKNGIVDKDAQEKALAMLPPDLATNVRSAGTYDMESKDFYGIRSQSGDRAKFDAIIKKIYPEFKASEFDVRKDFSKKWNSSPVYTQSQQSLDLVVQHMAAANDSFNELENGNVMLLNAGKNEAMRQLGASKISRAMIDAKAVATEFAKSLKGAGVLNQQEEKDWANNISTSSSPEQIKGMFAEFTNLLAPRFNWQLNKYKQTMGKYPDDAFTPEAINAMSKLSDKPLPSGLRDFISEQKQKNPSAYSDVGQGGYGGVNSTQVLTATNPKTGVKITSKDGGQTWQ